MIDKPFKEVKGGLLTMSTIAPIGGCDIAKTSFNNVSAQSTVNHLSSIETVSTISDSKSIDKTASVKHNLITLAKSQASDLINALMSDINNGVLSPEAAAVKLHRLGQILANIPNCEMGHLSALMTKLQASFDSFVEQAHAAKNILSLAKPVSSISQYNSIKDLILDGPNPQKIVSSSTNTTVNSIDTVNAINEASPVETNTSSTQKTTDVELPKAVPPISNGIVIDASSHGFQMIASIGDEMLTNHKKRTLDITKLVTPSVNLVIS